MNANSYKTHCKRGHPLSGDNLLLGPGRIGPIARRCRKCRQYTNKLAAIRRRFGDQESIEKKGEGK